MHLIDMSNNRANTAWVGQKPWHGLGQELEPDAPMHIWADAAGMNWTIERSGVFFKYPKIPKIYTNREEDYHLGLMDNRHVLFRSDTKDPLSVVSPRYQIVQPAEVLEFFRDLVGCNDFELDVAGCLDDGKKFWALARTGREISVDVRDKVQTFLLLSTSCDGSLATTAMFTSVRVVCNNTLQLAMGDSQSAIKIPHSRKFNPREVKKELGLVDDLTQLFEDQAVALSRRRLTNADVREFMYDVFGDRDKSTEDQPNQRAMANVFELFQGQGKGSTLNSADGTAWGLVNAVTEYADFHKPARSDATRLNSAWFGQGANLKKSAWNSALQLVA